METSIKTFQELFQPYEVEVISAKTSSEELMKHYFKLLDEGKQQGFHPIIVTVDENLVEKFELDLEDENLDFTAEGMKVYRQNIITKAQEIDARNLYNENKQELREALEEVYFEEPETDLELVSFRDLEDEDRLTQGVVIIKLPTDKPYEALAWLPIGGFNDCPPPAVQVAMAKYWHETYGAMPVAISYDVIEFYTPTPPSDKEVLYDLAMEHFFFDTDIVEQGMGCVEVLIESLYKNKTWYFWWD